MATDRRNSFAAIPQLEAQLEKILKENVIFEKKVINIQEFQSDFYSEYGQYKELIAGKFSAVTADIVYLKTFEADIENLYAEAVMTKDLSAEVAKLGYLSAKSAELEYVKIDKANIDSAWVENLLVTGNFLIDTVHGESGYYSKDLVGVNVAGDIIVGNTIKADALILQGTDGIYRRLNIDSLGETYVDSDPIYNQKLDGSVLVAESVTATEINVSDLFAQDITATGTITGAKLLSAYIESTSGKIGGFTIGDSALYNGATTLAGADNSVYLGLDGISCGVSFKVDKAGNLSATSGKIAGFTIDNDKLSNAENPTSVLDIGYIQEELKKWPGAMGDSSYIDYQGNMMVGKDNTGVGFYSLRRRGTPPVTISETRLDYKLDLSTGEKTDIVSSKLYAGLSGEAAVFVIGTNETMDSWTETWYSHAGFGSQYVEETGLGLTATDATMQAECNLDVTGNITSKGTAVSLSGHRHSRLYNTSDSSYEAQVALVLDGNYYFFRGSEASKYVCGSETRPWYKTFTENLEVTKGKPKFTYIGSKGGGSTVSYATNMYVGSTGVVSRTTNTSSRTIKHDITGLQDEQIKAENLYNVNVYQAKYNEDILSDDDPRYLKDLPMFIIEDLDEKYPVVIDKPSENVKEWSWNAQYIIPPMLKLIQMQHEEIEAIKAELKEIRKTA